MRLLLDEHYASEIATQLCERGHDVESAAARADLQGLSDSDLFTLMHHERRAILSENWADFSAELASAASSGFTHYGVIFTSRHQLPRSRNTIGLYVRVLDDFLTRHPAEDALVNTSHWLPDRPL